MKRSRIYKMGVALLALLLCAISVRAQNSRVRAQDSSAAAKDKATSGCRDADDLVNQVDDVISKLRNITPADLSSKSENLVDTLRDLKRRAELLKPQMEDCFGSESRSSTWNMGKDPIPLRMRMIAIELDYLNFVYETRFTEGDKSYFADSMPPDLERKIPECRGVTELLPKVSSFIGQYGTDEASSRIMPRDVMPFYDHGRQLLDCGLALVKSGRGAAARSVYGAVAGIDNLMVMADVNVEAKLNRELAIPAVQTQPIIIRYGPKSCTGHVWGDENYRTINWDCN